MFSNIATFSFIEYGNQKLPGYAQSNRFAGTAPTLGTPGALVTQHQLPWLRNGQTLQINGLCTPFKT